MKKYVLVLVMAISFLVVGCSGNKADTPNTDAETQVEEKKEAETVEAENKKEEVEEQTEEIKEEVKVEDLVSLMYDEAGTTKVCYDEGNEDATYDFEYSYKIPELTDDSQAAKKINYEINHMFADTMDAIEALKKNNGEKEMCEPGTGRVDYEAWINGDILSILIKADDAYVDWTTYTVINYDYVNKERLENADILALFGLSEEEFKNIAKKNIAKRQVDSFVEIMSYWEDSADEDSAYPDMLPSYISMHIDAVNDEDNSGSRGLFMAEDGKLKMVGFVYVPAGAGYYASIMDVDLEIKDVDTSAYKKLYDDHKYPGIETRILGLYEEEGLDYEGVVKNKNGEERNVTYYMGSDMTNPEKFLYQLYNTDDGEGVCYEGSLTFEDVDEEGIVFSFELTAYDMAKDIELDAKDKLQGSFKAKPHNRYDEEKDEYDDDVSIFYVDGDDLFSSDGKEIVMWRAVG